MRLFSSKKSSVLIPFLLVLMVGRVGHAAAGKRYSVEVRAAPVGDVVRMIAQMEGKNVVVPDKIEGVVTASFEDIDLESALHAILDASGIGMMEKGDVIEIATKEILEKRGEDLVITTFALKYAKAELVAPQVQSLISERGSVMVDARTNAITIRDTPTKLVDIQTLIANVDKLDRQVLIEAKIVEASTEFIRSLGIQWGITKTGGQVQTAGLTSVGTADSTRALNLNAPASGLNGSRPPSGVSLALGSFSGVFGDVQLSAAEERGDLSVLSRPSVVTLNNRAAKIRSGVKFFVKLNGGVTIGTPGTGGTTTGATGNLQQIDAGITMTVTPQITVDDRVNLVIDVTESQPDFSRAVDGIPAIVDNNASTTVLLRDGEPTVIGGLFQLQDRRNVRGVPGLMRIPLFGNLFRSTSKGKNRSELLIFIKPTIVKGNIAELPVYPEQQETTSPSPKIKRTERRR